MRRRRGRNKSGHSRVDALLDQVKKGADSGREQRPEGRWKPSRILSLKRDRALFEGLVTLDFDFLMAQPFAAAPGNLADLLPQSVVGRATNGHGYFTDDFGTPLCFPEATFERILSVLEMTDPNLNPQAVRHRRGEMLRSFCDYILQHIDDDELDLSPEGQPIFGIEFLAGKKAVTRDFLIGMVMAGFMDDWSYRANTMRHHRITFGGMPFHIGGGDILIVDAANLEMVGLGDTGASVFTDQEMRTLTDIGVICRNRHGQYSFPEYDQAYFRRQMGEGVCDDLAIIYIGAKFGFDAMMGAFVMDAIDTYDKYLLEMTWGGFDTFLAGRIQKHFLNTEDEPLVWDDAIFDLIHFAAKRNDPIINLSSSHRRLIQVEKGASVATVMNHWNFIKGQPLFDIKLGFSRMPGHDFYQAAWKRLEAVGMSVAEPTFIKTREK